MTDDDTAATAQSVYDAWDGQLRLDLSLTVDEDGRSFTGGRMQWWVAELRVPTEGYSSHGVVIGRCTAYTLYAPDSFDTVMGNFDVFQSLGDYRSALPIHHPAGGSFWELLTRARDLLGKPDLFTIDRIAIKDEYRDLHELTPVIVSALSNSPAGRSSAMVLIDPSTWNIPFTEYDQEQLSFAPWADTTVQASMNADPENVYDMTMNGGAGAPPVGSRLMDVNLGPALEHAITHGPIAVPFTLPPKLPADVWAGAPEDVHDVHADESNGTITIECHDITYEVVGAPGTAPQLVGTSAEAEPARQEWLRTVHQRWWQYEPDMHARIHELIDGYIATGVIDSTDDETVPHLHTIDAPSPESTWPGNGDVHLEPTSDDATEPAVFHAILELGDQHEHIGVVILHETGYLRAFLHDHWNPEHPNPDAAVEHLVNLAAKQFFAGAIHNELSDNVEHNLLTSDVRGH
jgi:hypothetical protein